MSGRCVACNSKLTEEEMCRKRQDTGEYLDMCTSCLREVADLVELPIDLGYNGNFEDEECVTYDEGETGEI